jgi:nucleotide-binding universal stress UspA family protein
MARIVVGFDGSETAHHAMQWAIQEARTRGATVDAVHAWTYSFTPARPPAPSDAVEIETVERDSELAFHRALDDFDAQGVPIHRHHIAGDPAAELLRIADGADMLVVGSRGRGALSTILLGSVSEEVIRRSPCPVVVIPSHLLVETA